jgi:hypothetical protein
VRRSTFSTFVKLNQSYENTCFVFNHRAGDCRVLRLSVTEEGRSDCDNVYGHNDDPRSVDHGQEDFDHKEDVGVGFDRSVAIGFAKEEHEEKGRS